jgi:hypothetical protein
VFPSGVKPTTHSAFLYLTDGRLFVRRDDGSILEADSYERDFARYLLTMHEGGMVDPRRGLQLLPPADC